jgi:hypothetical protein
MRVQRFLFQRLYLYIMGIRAGFTGARSGGIQSKFNSSARHCEIIQTDPHYRTPAELDLVIAGQADDGSAGEAQRRRLVRPSRAARVPWRHAGEAPPRSDRLGRYPGGGGPGRGDRAQR